MKKITARPEAAATRGAATTQSSDVAIAGTLDVQSMETTPQVPNRRRRLGVTALVLLAFLILGVATATAGGARKAHIVATTSPATPVAGKAFSITFSLVKQGVTLPMTGPDCLGMTNGRPIPLASKTSDGTTATCTWNVPTKTGPTFDGMLVAFDSSGTEYFFGYEYRIG